MTTAAAMFANRFGRSPRRSPNTPDTEKRTMPIPDNSAHNEASPLLVDFGGVRRSDSMETPATGETKSAQDVPSYVPSGNPPPAEEKAGDADKSSSTDEDANPSAAKSYGSTDAPSGDIESRTSDSKPPATSSLPSPPSSTSVINTGRFLLFLVAFLYGSLSVSLRMVYARPGPPAASILSATRGWMTVLCLLPLIMFRGCCKSKSFPRRDPPDYADPSFYGFCLELAVFNFGTQGLLNIGLLTTESARSAFFTQLSVVITPVLAATIGLCSQKVVVVHFKVWVACFLALFGLYVLSSDPQAGESLTEESDTDAFAFTWEYISLRVTGVLSSLSFGDWCCLGSAFCWSYYIYRLSDWGDRYDEAQTMFVKNIFMAIFYSTWTAISYFLTTLNAASSVDAENLLIGGNETDTGDVDDAESGGFYLWEGWRDPIALSILFYTALSSGAISDILQQKAQAHVPAAESNVILSLEPVFAAVLGLGLLAEIPSVRECVGGACIVIASILAST